MIAANHGAGDSDALRFMTWIVGSDTESGPIEKTSVVTGAWFYRFGKIDA
jgi:hypothetical protein